jgi:hypothetical protein
MARGISFNERRLVFRKKRFFFEKKNQKTSAPLGRCRSDRQRRGITKFFCFFLFTKRSAFLWQAKSPVIVTHHTIF